MEDTEKVNIKEMGNELCGEITIQREGEKIKTLTNADQ